MPSCGVRIAGVGHYAPARVVTNHDLEAWLDTSDDWIATRTGMKRRHWASEDEATSDLATAAASAALMHAGIRAQEIDCFIVATVTPDYYFPATACLVATKLGAREKAAFDVAIACSGFIYGLTIASGLIRAGIYERIMLIGAESLSKILDKNDRSTAILFGDGAGAVILERSEADSFLASDLSADGSRPELLYAQGSGARKPLDHDALDAKVHLIHMQGRETFKLAVQKMVEATESVLKKAGLGKADVTYLVPHQANRRIIDATARYLELPDDKVVINIEEYGNTSAASIPLALSEAVRAGLVKRDDLIVFVAFGGGLSWGAVAWRWA
ncbi:MAG: ketoacyl-ACP synthase III [Candidatus Eremiobacteraeota bacterium]|nr:ketoacyl-ACP synthase III [Candidatus Eremiobacteraeota bacterium]